MEWAEFLDQYGLPIAMLIALAVGRFVPGFVYVERKRELEEANDEIKRLNNYVIMEVAPALARQADAVERAMELLNTVNTERNLLAQQRDTPDARYQVQHPRSLQDPGPEQGQR